MRELALNILDIVENSVKAEAKNVLISVVAEDNLLTIVIKDDGKGMDEEFLKKVKYVQCKFSHIIHADGQGNI